MSVHWWVRCLVINICVMWTEPTAFIGISRGYVTIPVNEMLAGRGEAITEIDLSRNSISSICDDDLSAFVNVSRIVLSSNRIANVSDEAFCRTNVSELRLDHNFLNAVPKLACVGSSLTDLNLDFCRICTVTPDTFDGLSSLSTLSMQHNCLSSLEDFDLSPTALRYLFLGWNAFRTVGARLGRLSGLAIVSLAHNNISAVDPEAFANSSILWLDLGWNALTEFPDVRALGDSLNRLYLNDNAIGDRINGSLLSTLSGLYRLILDNNRMTAFPYQVCGDQSAFRLILRGLYLNGNLIRHLPDPVRCTQLRTLEIQANPLFAVPALGSGFNHLKAVRLDGTRIATVPTDNMAYLNSVIKLQLSNCSLADWSEVAKLFVHTKKLSTLSLSGNKLSDVGPEIYELTTLRALYLDNNKISCMPELPPNTVLRITHLDLRNNPLLCARCNDWLYSYHTNIEILVDPCHEPPIPKIRSITGLPTDVPTNGDQSTTAVSEKLTEIVTSTKAIMEKDGEQVIKTLATEPVMFLPVSMTSSPMSFALEWNEWVPWTDCTSACGGGIQIRWMLCTSPNNCTNNGTMYAFNDPSLVYVVQANQCNSKPCPLDGYWLSWATWSDCSQTCDSGLRSRRRICVAPLHGGKSCLGQGTEYEQCQLTECTREDWKRHLKELTYRPVYTESDDYPSNKGIGFLAIIFSLSVVVTLLILDLPTFKRDLVTLYVNMTRSSR